MGKWVAPGRCGEVRSKDASGWVGLGGMAGEGFVEVI